MSEKIDILSRDTFINNTITVIESLNSQTTGCCFAISGEWGIGKTHVLDLLKKNLSEIQSEETADSKYIIFSYNCWEYDYYEEPLLAIIASLSEQIDEENAIFTTTIDTVLRNVLSSAHKSLTKIGNQYIKSQTGIDLLKYYDKVTDLLDTSDSTNHNWDPLYAFKETLRTVQEELQKIAQYKSVVFIVDELDRCHPEYAIRILERLHHLFNSLPNCTVILSIDYSQLVHSIKQIFGNNTNEEKYLKKFIDFSIPLDLGKISDNFFEKYTCYFSQFQTPSDYEMDFLIKLFNALFADKDIRTQEKLLDKAQTVHKIVCHEEHPDFSLLCFELIYTRLSLSENITDFLTWVTDIYVTNIKSVKGYYCDSITQFFKEQKETITHATYETSGNYIILSTLHHKVMWLLSSAIQHVEPTNIAGNFYRTDRNLLASEQTYAREFRSFLSFIK